MTMFKMSEIAINLETSYNPNDNQDGTRKSVKYRCRS